MHASTLWPGFQEVGDDWHLMQGDYNNAEKCEREHFTWRKTCCVIRLCRQPISGSYLWCLHSCSVIVHMVSLKADFLVNFHLISFASALQVTVSFLHLKKMHQPEYWFINLQWGIESSSRLDTPAPWPACAFPAGKSKQEAKLSSEGSSGSMESGQGT